MNNSVFSEQDDLARGTNEPLQILLAAVEIQIVHCTTQCIRVGDSHILVLSSIQFDGTSFHEGMLEVADKILWVFNPNAKADEVLRESTGSTSRSVNRCVPATQS